MSDILRGEEIALCQIYFQSESAYSCLAQLGELGAVQFRDLNPTVNAFQRKYVNDVRRCDEMERKLRFFEKEIIKDKLIPIAEPPEKIDAPKPKEIIDIEATLEQLEHDLQEVNANKDGLKKNFLELLELQQVLTKANMFFQEHDQIQDEAITSISIEPADRSQPLRLSFMTGVIPRDKVPAFELMLFRICRGNVFLRVVEIEEPMEDPSNNDSVYKTVFILFFQGDQLRSKVKKICDGFKATNYPCPENVTERKEMSYAIATRIHELKNVLDQSLNLRNNLLKSAASNLRLWFGRVRKTKAIYHTMNLFNIEINQKCLISEVWAPVNSLGKIRAALERGTELSGGTVPSILNQMYTKEQPPTSHITNKFTDGFQNIVDSYGIATYREINPAIFTIITFPFLFAIMFGDTGHGFIMFLFALFMVLKEEKLKKFGKDNEVWQIFFGGRYIILLMAIFSIYTGLIYNDVFSKSINVFGSTWRVGVYENFSFADNPSFTLDPNPILNVKSRNDTNIMFKGTPYPFGLDPVWQLSINKISFTNSLKMKFAVIIGIMQMLFGLILALLNHIYFRRKINIFFEFIPQIIFMVFIFLYLCVMIFIKWLKYTGADDNNKIGPVCAPNLLIELIQMFFLSTAQNKDLGCDEIYPGQGTVQKILIVVAVLSIPVMLLVKPIVLYNRNKNKVKYGTLSNIGNVGHSNPNWTETEKEKEANDKKNDTKAGHDEDEEHFDISEIAVEQCIHTIEYFLGCISHTASYLRLWALSLAHAQLSEVLWTMVLKLGISTKAVYGFILLFCVFSAWAVFTVGVLLLMEGLSAFLHALRLHWVEFQSKFYKGEGYQFIPFSFKDILVEEASDN